MMMAAAVKPSNPSKQRILLTLYWPDCIAPWENRVWLQAMFVAPSIEEWQVIVLSAEALPSFVVDWIDLILPLEQILLVQAAQTV